MEMAYGRHYRTRKEMGRIQERSVPDVSASREGPPNPSKDSSLAGSGTIVYPFSADSGSTYTGWLSRAAEGTDRIQIKQRRSKPEPCSGRNDKDIPVFESQSHYLVAMMEVPEGFLRHRERQ